MKRALICGITGQDGAYLAQLLLSKDYEIWGTSRDAQVASFANLKKLGIFEKIKTISMACNDFRSVLQAITISSPDEIYNLSGQSSVGLSFEQPVETLESISTGTLNILEVIRFIGKSVRFYNAGSGECFGNIPSGAASEGSFFAPQSPYAIAKSTSFWLVSNYRASYGIYACTGILFNHESPFRPNRFVTRKIIQAAINIASGKQSNLILGDINIARDWGWCSEYVDAMWRMLQIDEPNDFVIATGKTNTLLDFIKFTFDQVDLDWEKYVIYNNEFVRPSEIQRSCGNARKANELLGWEATIRMHDVIKLLIHAEYQAISDLNYS